jgi:hypothetical protein
MVIVGLDAHMKTCVIVAKNEDGTLVESSSFETTRENLAELALRYPGAEIVLESSGVSTWIYEALKENGARPVAAHPVNIRRVLGTKDDRSDAEFYRAGRLLSAIRPPPRVLSVLALRVALGGAPIDLHKERSTRLLSGHQGVPAP